mmetsp:Transcript_13970/g.28258  ORF Transcript_13970/g.28258 Transcript_13970/m.28258 type:complete len:327 (+) Transcript_13970:1725-2705(+)
MAWARRADGFELVRVARGDAGRRRTLHVEHGRVEQPLLVLDECGHGPDIGHLERHRLLRAQDDMAEVDDVLGQRKAPSVLRLALGVAQHLRLAVVEVGQPVSLADAQLVHLQFHWHHGPPRGLRRRGAGGAGLGRHALHRAGAHARLRQFQEHRVRCVVEPRPVLAVLRRVAGQVGDDLGEDAHGRDLDFHRREVCDAQLEHLVDGCWDAAHVAHGEALLLADRQRAAGRRDLEDRELDRRRVDRELEVHPPDVLNDDVLGLLVRDLVLAEVEHRLVDGVQHGRGLALQRDLVLRTAEHLTDRHGFVKGVHVSVEDEVGPLSLSGL